MEKEITDEEMELIKIIREIRWGTIEGIEVKDGNPVIITKVIQTIKIGGRQAHPIDR